MSIRPPSEDPLLSCRYLANRIAIESDQKLLPLLLEDLATKSIHAAETPLFQGEDANLLGRTDLVVFTVIQAELPAVKIALGIDPKAKAEEEINGIRVWRKALTLETAGQKISVRLAFIGEPTNAVSASACTAILLRYKPRVAALIGIAAGNRSKTNLVDVVTATDVIYYEPQSLLPDACRGPRYSPT